MQNPERSFHALTCGIAGWLVHSRYFASEAEAHAAWEELAPALVELAQQLPSSEAQGLNAEAREAGARLAAFVARFP